MKSTNNDLVLCKYCNQLHSFKYGEFRYISYVEEFICHNCLGTFEEVPQAEIKAIISILKNSKRDFVQSIIQYYNEKGRITQKQYGALRRVLTNKQYLKFLFLIKDIENIILSDLNDEQLLELIDLIKESNYKLSKSDKRRMIDNTYNEEIISIIQNLNQHKKVEKFVITQKMYFDTKVNQILKLI